MTNAEAKRQAWLKARKGSTGGSDAACVCGYDPYKPVLELYYEATGEVDPKDLSGNEAVQWGHRLEGAIADAWAEEAGAEIHDLGEFTIQRRADHPQMHTTLDRLIMPWRAHAMPGVLQVKNVGTYMAKQWEDGTPLAYQIQLQHEMFVCDVRWGVGVALIGGQRLVWSVVSRSDGFCGGVLVPAVRDFWRRVEAKEPPPVDANCKAILDRRYTKVDEIETPLDWSAAEASERILLNEAVKSAAETKIDTDKNRIRQMMGGAERGILPGDNGSWSWKRNSKGSRTLKRAK